MEMNGWSKIYYWICITRAYVKISIDFYSEEIMKQDFNSQMPDLATQLNFGSVKGQACLNGFSKSVLTINWSPAVL